MRLRLLPLVVTTIALTLPAAASGDLTWSGPIALDHNGKTGLTAVACPADTQCTAVDTLGQQVTFAPASGAGAAASTTSPGASPAGVACPSAHQCTQVDESGEEGFPSAVACETTSLSVAVDDSGAVVSFDPGSPRQRRRRSPSIRAAACRRSHVRGQPTAPPWTNPDTRLRSTPSRRAACRV